MFLKRKYSIHSKSLYNELFYRYAYDCENTLLKIILLPIFIIFVAACSPDDEFDNLLKLFDYNKTCLLEKIRD